MISKEQTPLGMEGWYSSCSTSSTPRNILKQPFWPSLWPQAAPAHEPADGHPAGHCCHDEGTIRSPSRDGLEAQDFLALFHRAWSGGEEPQCGCHPWLEHVPRAPAARGAVWPWSQSDTRAAGQGWLCSPLQPPLCLQVQHRLMLQLAVLPALHCPRMCQATHPELRAHPHPSLSLSSISLTLLPCWSSAPLAATGALQNHAGGSSSVVSKTQPASRVHLSSQTGILLLGWFPKKHSLCHGDGDVRTYVRPSQPFRILDLLG